MNPLISIIHPSRQRAFLAARTANSWLSSAKAPEHIEYIVSIDSDDNAQEYIDQLGTLTHSIKFTVNHNKSAVEAINNAAKVSQGNLIIVVSDDFNLAPFHWDEYLLTELKDKQDYIVKTDDGAQPWIITLPIMDRAYYNRFGYVYNPLYLHLFSDTEMTAVADVTARLIKLPLKIPHHHYTTGKNVKDAVSEKADKTWAQGEAIYLERFKNNFGFEDGIIKCDASHLHWLRSKGVEV